jgi:hypothetical protein
MNCPCVVHHTLGVTVLVVIASKGFIGKDEPHQAEYYCLMFLAVTGMMLVAAATDLILMYIAFEMSGLCTFALTAFRKKDEKASEASMKFFIIGAISYLYGIPYGLYSQYKIRRYGFHGTSHLWVAKKAAAHLEKPLGSLNLITLHLGNGASAAAIRQGLSVDTSMGMTPLEGFVMGTRCGDLDPAVSFYLRRMTQMPEADLEAHLLVGAVGLEVDVQEGRGPPQGHRGAVLFLYSGQIAKVEPLDRLFAFPAGTEMSKP